MLMTLVTSIKSFCLNVIIIIYCLTNTGNWKLHIDFTFDNGTKSFIIISEWDSPATDNYQLNISGFI